MPEHTGKLHIYAQDCQHADAWIVGDRQALTDLRDALTRVLAGQPNATVGTASASAAATHAYCEDGEGYLTLILRVDDDATWQTLHLPYAELPRKRHPFSLIDHDVYRGLHKG